jgi:hypothetical protein
MDWTYSFDGETEISHAVLAEETVESNYLED